MFSLLRKIAFTSKIMVHKWETCFHYSEKYFLQAKIYPSTNKKYVYTIYKNRFYRQNTVFPEEYTMPFLLGKIIFKGKKTCFKNWEKTVFTNKKLVAICLHQMKLLFTCQNIIPLVGNMFLLPGNIVFIGKKYMFSLAENMFPLPGKIVITHEIMFWLVVIQMRLLGQFFFCFFFSR